MNPALYVLKYRKYINIDRLAISDGAMHAFIILVEVLEGDQRKHYIKFRTPNLKNEKFIKDVIKINQ